MTSDSLLFSKQVILYVTIFCILFTSFPFTTGHTVGCFELVNFKNRILVKDGYFVHMTAYQIEYQKTIGRFTLRGLKVRSQNH